jgi:hypothetical protein
MYIIYGMQGKIFLSDTCLFAGLQVVSQFRASKNINSMQ